MTEHPVVVNGASGYTRMFACEGLARRGNGFVGHAQRLVAGEIERYGYVSTALFVGARELLAASP